MENSNIKFIRSQLMVLLSLMTSRINRVLSDSESVVLKTYTNPRNKMALIHALWELSEEAIHISDFANNKQLDLYTSSEDDLILKSISVSTGISKNSLYALCNLIHKTMGCGDAVHLLKQTLTDFDVEYVTINPDTIEPYSFYINDDNEVLLDTETKLLDVKFLRHVLRHFDNVCKLHPLKSIKDHVKYTNASLIE